MVKSTSLLTLFSFIAAVSLLCLSTSVSCQYTGGSYGNYQQQQRSNSFLGNPLSSIRSLFSLGSFGRPRAASGYGSGVLNRQGLYNQYGAYNPSLYGNTYTQQQRPPTYNSLFSG
ncbi:hypothetical protein TYRP_003418 [Tyrophagus putrescentiae]|nr:hypothetical protein TYRP_003418 [Tyrophagus putrescentiae]